MEGKELQLQNPPKIARIAINNIVDKFSSKGKYYDAMRVTGILIGRVRKKCIFIIFKQNKLEHSSTAFHVVEARSSQNCGPSFTKLVFLRSF